MDSVLEVSHKVRAECESAACRRAESVMANAITSSFVRVQEYGWVSGLKIA
jgi:hypothetical protein